jgi:hypothetical protein
VNKSGNGFQAPTRIDVKEGGNRVESKTRSNGLVRVDLTQIKVLMQS